MEKQENCTKTLCFCTSDPSKAAYMPREEDKTTFTETNPLKATSSTPWSAFKDLYWI